MFPSCPSGLLHHTRDVVPGAVRATCPCGAETAKRVDALAAALYHGMYVEALTELELSYSPPSSSPWDSVQMAAQAWCGAFGT